MGALGRSLGLGLGVSLGGGDHDGDSDTDSDGGGGRGRSGRRVRFFRSPTDLLSFDTSDPSPTRQVGTCALRR